MNRNSIILLLVGIAIVASIIFLESKKPEKVSVEVIEVKTISKEEKSKIYEPAKEISTPNSFINTEKITIGELIGKKVILVDFWTYSCINCQRTLPHLNSWYQKYKDDGLEIVAIHTPEFEFEKEYNNVVRAVKKFGIKYPVVLDNDFSTWSAYRNQYWPRKYLIDIDGYIVYDHIGEGAYDETEKKIVELLNERSSVLGEEAVGIDQSVVKVEKTDFSKVGSPEMYLGANRIQYISNLPSVDCLNNSCELSSSKNPKLNFFELNGKWNIQEEKAVLESQKGSIFVRFSANKVNLVASGGGEGISAEIYLDGKLSGEVIFKEDGLYNLIDLKGNYGEHLLEIRIKKKGLETFAFTFG